MDLDAINFKVQTKELESAIQMVDSVSSSLQGLTKEINTNTSAKSSAAKASKEELAALKEQVKLKGLEADAAKKAAQAAEAESKAKVAKIKEEKELTKVVKDSSSASDVLTESMTASERILAKQALSMQILRGEVITTSDGVAFLGNSFTKSQAGMLANLQLLGATGKELQTLSASFKDYNAITGLNTFDKSASGISKMKKELQELNEVNSISASGLSLTRDEITNFVRDSERLVQQQKSEGHSAEWLAEEQKQLRASYISTSVELNRLRAESLKMEEQAKKSASSAIKATQDKLKAEEFVAREMNRVNQAAENSRTGTTVTTSNQLVKMDAALKASGISAAEASKKFALYKQQLLDLQKVANNRQIDNISRALGPQITDITVGLATGQSPMTILLQQGGQLRDQMALAGVAANDMGKAIRKAGSEMISSVWTTGLGVFTGIGGAMLDIGKKAGEGIGTMVLKMVDFVNGIEKLGGGIEYQKKFNQEVLNGNGALSKMFDILTGSVASTVFATGIVTLIGTLVSLGVAMAQVIKEENALSKSLILSGGALGLNKDSAYAYTKELEKLGISGSGAVNSLIAIAETGKFTKSEIENVTKAAVALNKSAGVDIKDTVAEFVKLKEKPVEALLELAAKLGTIPPETLRAVRAAKDYGTELEAQTIAQEAYADAAVAAARKVREEMGTLSSAAKAFGDAWAEQWDRVLNLFRGNDLSNEALLATRKLSLAQMKKDGPRTTWGWTGSIPLETKAAWEERIKEEEFWIADYTEKIAIANAKSAEQQRNTEIANTEKRLQSYRDSLEKERKSKLSLSKYLETEVPKILGASPDVIKLRDSLTGGDQYKTAVDAATKQWKDMQKKNTEASKQAAKELSFYESTMRGARGELEQNKGAVENLTKAQIKLNEVQSDPRFKQLSKERKDEITAIYKQASVLELYNKALDDSIKLEETLKQVKQEYDSKALEAAVSVELENAGLDHRINLVGKTAEQQKRLTIEYEKNIKLKKLDLELQKDIQEAEKKYGPDIVGLMQEEERLYQQYADKRKVIDREAAVAAAEAYHEEFQGIQKALAETIEDALFNGGKKGSKSLRDAILDQLKKPINVVINVIANAVTSGIQGMLGGQTGTQATGQGGFGFGNIGSLISSAGSLFEIGSQVIGGTMSLANAGATMFANATATGIDGLMAATNAFGTGTGVTAGVGSAMGSIGSAMPWIGAGLLILQATGALERWAGDPDAFLVQETKGSSRPIGNNSMFKPKGATNPYQSSVDTSFGTIGFASGNAVVNKGGLRFDYGETEDVSIENQKEVLKIFDTYDEVIAGALSESQVAKIAKDLQGWYKKSWSFEGGMISNWVADRYKTIFGLMENEIGAAFAKLDFNGDNVGNIVALFSVISSQGSKVSGLLESLKSFADGTSKYIRENEKGAEALIRMISNLTVANQLFDAIGLTAYESSLAGADMAQKLVDIFGGLSNFQSGLSGYYDKFYTSEEKVAKTTQQLTSAFADLGYTLPSNIMQFRELVNSQDLTTESGRKTFAALIGMSSAFSSIVEPLDEATNKLEEFRNSILEYVASLNLNEGVAGNSYESVKQQFATQLGLAKTGDSSAMENITEYADRLLQLAQEQAGSTYEYEKILGSVKSELLGLTNGETAGTILTNSSANTSSTAPITTIADSSESTQELLVSILAKLTEMQAEERAEGEASVTNLSTIAKVFKRIDNGDSIRVISV